MAESSGYVVREFHEKCFDRSQYNNIIAILSCFHGGHVENHPKWRSGPKIWSVNILILNQGVLMNNTIPLPEGP